MSYTDLTHTFSPSITLYPGSKPPIFEQLATVPVAGYAAKRITFQSHHGTHIDATAHMVANGKTLDQLPLDTFMGKAITIDVQPFAGKKIPKLFFESFEKDIREIDFVLLHTGWSKKWKTGEYENNYPTMTEEATHFLCNLNLKGIGMDCFSPDPVDSPDYANHHIAFAKNVLFIENLTNLDKLPFDKLVNFQCFPMKIEDADGAPVRAIAYIDSDTEER